MAQVNFPVYRDYIDSCVNGNNAMMALLTGSHIATKTLDMTRGSALTLSEMYPQVPHIQRFNFKNDVAVMQMSSIEAHLATVAIPYALAIHEAFVGTARKMLESNNVAIPLNGQKWNAETMHGIIFSATNYVTSTTTLEIYDLLRRARNDLIHNGGRVSDYLKLRLNSLSSPAVSEWFRITGKYPTEMAKTDRLQLGAEEIFITFATIRNLGRSINDALVGRLPDSYWASVAVIDFIDSRTELPQNRRPWMRKLRAHANSYYEALHLSDDALEAASESTTQYPRF